LELKGRREEFWWQTLILSPDCKGPVGVSQGHHFGSSATLRLRPDLVLLPDGFGLFVQSLCPSWPHFSCAGALGSRGRYGQETLVTYRAG
jgi:hypothetical protein